MRSLLTSTSPVVMVFPKNTQKDKLVSQTGGETPQKIYTESKQSRTANLVAQLSACPKFRLVNLIN